MRTLAVAAVLVSVAAAQASAAQAPPRVTPLTCVHPPGTPWLDSDPAWSPDGQQIAFVRGGNARSSRLLVARPDGSQMRAVAVADGARAWASAGHVVFESAGEIVFIELASGSTRSVGLGTDPAVSPDGSRLAFARDGLLWTSSLEGSDGQQVTRRRPGVQVDSDPAWSPDGKRIAFGRSRGVGLGGMDVWVIDANGTNERQVTNNDFYNTAPAWSPDGARLAFHSWVPNLNAAIHTIRADGTNERALTLNSNFSADAYRTGPAWSPRPEIAFAATRYEGTTGRWGSEIRTLSPDGGTESRLTYHCQFGNDPDRPNLIYGTALTDIAYGYGGNDRLFGFRHHDRLAGGSGKDYLDGGFGNDRLDGGLDADVLAGGSGNDVLHAKDGTRDHLNCGPGHDIAHADRHDLVSQTCERIYRSPPQPRR